MKSVERRILRRQQVDQSAKLDCERVTLSRQRWISLAALAEAVGNGAGLRRLAGIGCGLGQGVGTNCGELLAQACSSTHSAVTVSGHGRKLGLHMSVNLLGLGGLLVFGGEGLGLRLDDRSGLSEFGGAPLGVHLIRASLALRSAIGQHGGCQAPHSGQRGAQACQPLRHAQNLQQLTHGQLP